MYRALIGLAAVFAVTSYYFKKQISELKINNITIKNKKIDKTFKILQLSDFHSNPHLDIDELESIVDEIDPDLAVLTGDMAEQNLLPVEKLIKMLTKKQFPKYMILGNHEEEQKHLENYLKIIEESDIIYLDNKVETIEINGNSINIIGLEHENPQLSKLRTSFDNDKFNLILSHAPNTILNMVTNDDDLVLSGHTHGGQVRLPLIGAIYVPNQFPIPRYIKGLYELETGTKLYVDSGMGTSRLPLRALNPVQISVITIQNDRQ